MNKYNVGIGLIILGALFFFSKFVAPEAPLLGFLSQYASIAFGDMGLGVFFGLCILMGVLVLARGHLMKTLLKQFVIMMFVISSVLNFSILSAETTNRAASSQYGGYFSWPIYMLLEQIFGHSEMAIKIIVIIFALLVLGWFLYTLNVKLPKLPKINVEKYEQPVAKREQKSGTKPYITRESHTTSDSDILKKISQAAGTAFSSAGSKPSEAQASLLKDMLKKKLDTKLDHKIEKKRPRPAIKFSGDKPTFPYSLLESDLGSAPSIDQNFIMEKAKSLQRKLMEFNIPVTIEGFDIGPSIVQIKIKPSEGIKISSIENLANDIKLSLKSKSLRIVAPIPGTDSVGIQIPNPKPSMVRIGDMLNSVDFQKAMKDTETGLALGKGIDGAIISKPLESMPHLLVAGATGSGKSVGINDFILSLMFQNSPSELKFLMVDPKQVELEMYSGLPYMLAPIVYDSTKAIKLLQRTVQEMERRYTILKEQRVRNLTEYNAKNSAETMYRIVFVIDEMADMMLSSSANRKEVENCINRLAAKARAVGIHLILATQRPSVNVITGLIKANIPTRMAFGVVSEIDSRTILGRKGAEDLVGKGDMLYMDPSTKFPIRIQAPFVSTEEIEKVVASLKNKYMQGLTEEDIYNPEIIAALESKAETASGAFAGSGDDDDLVEQAIQVIAETRKASATLLQRKLGVGFARAARIMDILEERGVIGPQDGARARDIFL
ncbi:MAG: DNA translocase FtsK [Candidatus Absconditabacteria bacterium]|nr:DNA translocase FtsK [Candidatus Absconditabacteria bacterium]